MELSYFLDGQSFLEVMIVAHLVVQVHTLQTAVVTELLQMDRVKYLDAQIIATIKQWR